MPLGLKQTTVACSEVVSPRSGLSPRGHEWHPGLCGVVMPGVLLASRAWGPECRQPPRRLGCPTAENAPEPGAHRAWGRGTVSQVPSPWGLRSAGEAWWSHCHSAWGSLRLGLSGREFLVVRGSQEPPPLGGRPFVPGYPCCLPTWTCYGPQPSSERCPSFPDFGEPGRRDSYTRRCLGGRPLSSHLVHPGGWQGHAFCPGNPRNAPRDQPALLDSSRKGWATAVLILSKPKPQISA